MSQQISASQTPPREDVLRILQKGLPYLRLRFGVARLAIYGSFSRGDQTPQSVLSKIETILSSESGDKERASPGLPPEQD